MRSRATLLGVVLLLSGLVSGCREEAKEPAIVVPSDNTPASVVRPKPPESGSVDEGKVKVELRFYGVSDLYRGFFADPRAVGPLSEALAGCVEGTAQILVSYDQESRIGRIVMKVPPESSSCLPRATATGADLSPLEPVGVALAEFRDRVSSSFDYRIASFRVGTSFTRGTTQCNLQISGSHPPDGRRWNPCVGFGGVERCGDGDPEEGVQSFVFSDAKSRNDLAACFKR